ncbi:double-stranded RNA-specific editase Adar isoform X5 [Topomyia yanbarensis]|uniref:double-stranded RNA-specific editase Adar isoform X5 n=1 Tax=Topomyia yanbarensis TaxID=2498891 RepID=UPI00273C95C7|nr:double-stranded RNA-specific editase Adar isoform X5 [Topomyia yanbarensis]
MRPNTATTVYDRYRWKKMDHSGDNSRKSENGTAAGQKIPVLTHGTPPGSAVPIAASGTPPAGTPGSGGTSPSRRATKRRSSSVNIAAGSAAARKRRKLQQTPPKTGEPSAEQLPQTKNTVAVLNELKRNLVYNLESQTGPVHAPIFSMSVVVDGQKFVGHGRSKKLARIEAAAAALRSFIQFKDGATLTPIKPMHNVDFTSDDPMIENSVFPLSDPPTLPEPAVTSPSSANSSKASSKGSPSEKNHISRRAETKERQNGPNHSNNNNTNNNNNNNVHSTNNILATTTSTTASQPPSSSSSSISNSASSATTTTAVAVGNATAQNGHRQVVDIIQQSLDLFKNSNEKNVAWKKRLEKLKSSASNASRNGSPGQPPKPQPEKGPVMLLHELFTDATFECVSTDGLQHSKFTVVVTVDNQRFEGTGPSKKMAKNAAAKAALASMCNISFSPLQQAKFGALMNSGAGAMGGAGGGGSPGMGINGDASYDQKSVELPQTFADAIGKLVIEKFNEVMVGNDVYSRRKVLAGIVLTEGYDVKTAKVISLATGTKCVSGEHMSVTGSVINDSHAEIIARRGLLDYFYTQLNMFSGNKASNSNATVAQYNGKQGNNNTTARNSNNGELLDSPMVEQEACIFVAPSEDSTLYRLRDGLNFHLYINTAPCGDARVFSPHENDNMDVDKHPNRKARGQLRTKVESGEGTIPVKSSEGIQTWDGVLQGQRLLTMSCSDKISRWNVLGLQGSLLASVIEPIYLHSIVLGSLLHPAHMYRAICGRVESSIQGLPPPYRLNKPRLALMTSAESRNQTKPPNFSINWVIGCSEVEIVNSFTGKLINNNTNTNKMSRLSKQSFYRRYAAVIEKLPIVRFREVKPSYYETKMSIPEYQQAKKELFAAFAKEDLGDWLKKPIEQDQFTLIPPRPEEMVSVTSANTSSSSNSSNNSSGPVGGNNGGGSTPGGK